MKKKILSILLLSIFMFTQVVNVWADTLPKDYEHDGYTYSIESFALRVYEFDLEENAQDIENNTITIAEESLLSYLDEQFIDEIELSLEDFTYTPTYHEEVIYEEPTTVIDLGITISEEKLKSLLQEYYSSITDEKNYYVELIVKFKIKNIPTGYNDFGKNDIYRFVLKSEYIIKKLESYKELNNAEAYPTGLNKEFHQTISKFLIRSEDLEYTRDIAETDGIALYCGLGFISETGDEANNKLILFSNVNDTKKLARGITKSLNEYMLRMNEDDPVPDNPTTGTDTVPVPDTAMNVPLLYTLGGITIAILGFSIIIKTLNKKSTS